MKSVLLALLLAVGLSACSVATRMGMRPATAPVFLVLGGELYTGEAQGFNDRRASLTLRTDAAGQAGAAAAPAPGSPPLPVAAPASPSASPLTCAGTLAFLAERTGTIELVCSNGTQPRLTFESTAWATGYAYGTTGAEPVSLTFGLPAESASAYLRAPGGKKLVLSPPDSLKLE